MKFNPGDIIRWQDIYFLSGKEEGWSEIMEVTRINGNKVHFKYISPPFSDFLNKQKENDWDYEETFVLVRRK